MKFKATLDSLARGITIGVIVLFSLLSLVGRLTSSPEASGFPTDLWIFLLFLIILLGTWLFAPMGYRIDPTYLSIRRPIGPVRICLADILESRRVGADELRGLIRTFGSGGLFGYYGKFFNKTLGPLTLYTTRRTHQILIRTRDGKKIVLSPDDADGFLSALASPEVR